MAWKNVLVSLVVAVVGLAGCGADEAQVVDLNIGVAPTVATGKVAVSAAPRNDFLAFDKWPNACDLITEADVKAILPQATKIERSAGPGKVYIFDFTGDSGGEKTVPNGKCTITYWYEGTEKDESLKQTLDVGLLVAGDAAVVTQNFNNKAEISSYGPADVPGCLRTDSEHVCRSQNLMFSVEGTSLMSSRSFRIPGQPETVLAFQYFRQHATPEFAKAALAKLG